MEKTMSCQSCNMPLSQKDYIGTNSDGSPNNDYCIFCFKDGAFINNVRLDEFIANSLQFASQIGMTEDEMREYCNKTLPTLKRWKCTCTDECAGGYNPNCNCTSSECSCTEK